MVKIGRNSENVAAVNITNTITLSDNLEGSGSFEYSREMQLNANDSLCIILDKKNRAFDFNESGNNFQVRLVHMEDYEVNFTEALSDFSIRDFLNEVIYRFGLTIFKDKYSNNYRFATLEELLETATTANWSRRFVSKTSESYLTGNYAQRNTFSYVYNDKEAGYNDGYLQVHNINLPDTKALFKSKIYSPELLATPYPQSRLNVYKMWEKETVEPDEDNETVTVKYKPLDKRFYFMYSKTSSRPHVAVSLLTGQSQGSTIACYESFSGLPFKDIMQKYYAPVSNMLSRALVVTAELYLSENDVANFDFNKFYYIEQLGGSFLVNKIINYVPGRPVTVELIRIRQGFYNQLPLYITAIEASQDTNGSQQITVHFISQLEAGTNITLQYQTEDIWENPLSGATSPLVFNVPAQLVGQTKRMRLGYQGGISNQVTAIWLGTYTVVV